MMGQWMSGWMVRWMDHQMDKLAECGLKGDIHSPRRSDMTLTHSDLLTTTVHSSVKPLV